jgi:hypothetical protein
VRKIQSESEVKKMRYVILPVKNGFLAYQELDGNLLPIPGSFAKNAEFVNQLVEGMGH